MKQSHVINSGIVEMNRDELKSVTGGGDFIGYVRCVASTLTSGGGGARTWLLGTTVFGMARTVGVLLGCI
jgi:hypothetical protein